MNAVCPACGVPVVPGYVRCPRCHAGLPLGARIKRTTADPGGTAVAQRGFPILAVLAPVAIAAAIIVVFAVRGSGKQTAAAQQVPSEPTVVAAQSLPPRVTTAPLGSPLPEPAPSGVAAPDGRAAVLRLEDTLRRARLWGRAEITGQRVDVRSGLCGDKAMRPAIESERAVLHGAGLTKLRCLEQSGAVVFESDL
jgi:hypothetical protein